MKILYITSGSGENPWIADIVAEFHEKEYDLEVVQATSETMDAEEKVFHQILLQGETCSLLLLSNHGSSTYFKKWDRFIAFFRERHIPAFIQSSVPEEMGDYRDLFPYPDTAYQFLHAGMELSGKHNTRTIIQWALATIGGCTVEIPSLEYPRTEGFYHPALADITDPKPHYARVQNSLPTIGILIHQSTYLRQNLRAIDQLIDAIEKEGMNALTIFLSSSPDTLTGAAGIRAVIETYLITEGRPRVDSLIIAMGFSQISLSDPGDGTSTAQPYNFFQDLNVPVIQALTMYRPYDAWEADIQGLTPMEISSSIVWPEFDGQIISVPLAYTGEENGNKNIHLPIPGRPEKIAAMARRWADLKRTPVSQRKAAIVIYQYTGNNDTLGGAYGLDTPESILEILRRLRAEGYTIDHIPQTGNDLVTWLLNGLTNDTRWIDSAQMKSRAAASIPAREYQDWFSSIPTPCQEKMKADWGQAPGDVFVVNGDLCIPGIINGNIFIGIQPPRGYFDQMETMYHSTDLVMPHHYLAYYRWIRDVFGAHAVIHLGTHGTLEWLPGKGVGLSRTCYPDIIFDDMPHFYPYIMNNPGEGTQAKRRSWAVILDHLIPTMMRAEGYGELVDLDAILQEYFRSQRGGERGKAAEQISRAREMIIQLNLTHDLKLSSSPDDDEIRDHAEEIYDYLCEIRDTIIKDGLHIFGSPPDGKRFTEMLYALTRLNNGNIPSLRECIGAVHSLDLRALLENPSGRTDEGTINGVLIDQIDRETTDLLCQMDEKHYQADVIMAELASRYGQGAQALDEVIRYICTTLAENLHKTTDEGSNLIRGLAGGYVPPGPSGDPTRGSAHLLPTGRNFYSIDPATIPTPAAWETGKELADQMIQRYIAEQGKYPERIGIIVFATDTMRTGGDDIAYILWLMGLRPVWSCRGGAVTGLEIISTEELGRPRIDVSMRITGLFRDTFPALIHLLDDGISMIASLDENDKVNYLAAHLRQELIEKITEGFDTETARDLSLIRIFGCPPGNYGAGVSEVVNASAWDTRKDLADVFTCWSAHAYGRKFRGEKYEQIFRSQFGSLDATVKNRPSREIDVLDNDDDYTFLGGMNACVQVYGGSEPVSVIGDASDPDRIRTRLVDEEIRFVFRSRVLNPAWLEGLKPHGFRGAQEIVSTVEYVLGWDATSEVIDDWEYESLASSFLFNDTNREWIEENNPYALRSITGRLLEASDRGLWNAEEETLEKLRGIFLKTEYTLEERGERN